MRNTSQRQSRARGQRILFAATAVFLPLAAMTFGRTTHAADDPTTLASVEVPVKTLIDAKVSASVAAQSASVAASSAASANAAASAASAEVADVRASKLIQYGITGGVAATLQVGISSDNRVQNIPHLTTMPYVMIVPAYWWYHGARRIYCAAQYTGSEADAWNAAVAEGKKKSYRPEDILQEGNVYPCWSSKIGFYAGLPLQYSATTTIDENNAKGVRSERTVKPIVAFGVGLIPNAYISVLLGGSLGTVDQASSTATDGTVTSGARFLLYTLTFGIGGNLDILAALAK